MTWPSYVRGTLLVCAIATAVSGVAAFAGAPKAVEEYGRLPMRFERNEGQAQGGARYVSRGVGYTMLFHDDGMAEVRLQDGRRRAASLRLKFSGQATKADPQTLLPGVSNYLRGNDPSLWRRGIRGYAGLRYPAIYPDIDLVYYGNQKQLEYDFELAPHADPNRIRMSVEGARALRLDANGDLLVETAAGTLRQLKPVAYQVMDGRRVVREAAYRLDGNTVTFALGKYDRSQRLIIDPILSYSTFLGGAFADAAFGMTVDANGAAYIIGQTASGNFPTVTPAQASNGGGTSDVFVTKLAAGGNQLVYSTYIGGNGEDIGVGIAVDAAGAAHITGHTTSTNFPLAGPISNSLSGARDAFVARLSPGGNALQFSTYLGGSQEDRALAIAVDSASSMYVAGTTNSADYPRVSSVNPNFNGVRDAFVTKIVAAGTISYSSLIGGGGDDAALGVAVDSTNAAYVTGYTGSTNFPTQSPINAANAGGLDAFLTKLTPAGALAYSTYMGGTSDDRATAVALDSTNAAYVAGWTFSSNFPTVSPLSSTFSGFYEGFVSKVNPGGSALVYSTYLGGNGEDFISSIAVDSTNAAVVAGYTSSSNFPVVATSPAFANGRTNGAFVARLNPAGGALEFSTYFGGASTDQANAVATDANRAIYVAGSTISAELPVVSAFQTSLQGNSDAFVAKFSEGTPVTFTVTTNPANLQVTVDGVTAPGPRYFGWAPGSEHTLNAPSPQGGGPTRYSFSTWSQGGNQSQTITAPAADATYTANYAVEHLLTLNATPAGAGTLNASPGGSGGYYASGTAVQLSISTAQGYVFTGFSGDLSGTTSPQSVTMSQPRTVNATFACVYQLSSTGANVDGGAATGSFNITTGATCPFTATSNADWLVITGGGNGPGSRTLSYTVAPNPTTQSRTAVISVNDAVGLNTYTVTQGPQPPASITVTTTPSGLQFVLDGATYTSPRTFQFTPSSTHSLSAVSPQTANGVRHTFVNWSNGGGQSQQVIAPANGALILNATFNVSYQLSAIINPPGSGAVTFAPASPDGFYTPGTVVTLTASSNVGASFTGFTGALNGSTNPQQLTMTSARTVIAEFAPLTCGTNYLLAPQQVAAPATGGDFTITVTTQPGCFWGASLSAAFVDPWITLTGNTAATGTNTFTFTAQPNTTNSPRTASVSVQGNLVQVVQKGVDVPLPFNDVAAIHPFFDFISLMKRYGNSNGCGNNNYCPEDITTRGTMAELIIRSRFGEEFTFPQAPLFTDVPTTHPQFKYIQKMKELGITDGCTTTTYCPSAPVTRGEMAVFLIRTRLGVLTPQQFTYNTATYFQDVETSHIFFPYIQKMKELGITAGCTATNYCGNDVNTLGQMAVFVIRSFNTP